MYKVLIVEQDPMVAAIHEQCIRHNKKFQVIGKCRDVSMALDFLQHQNADLIIWDAADHPDFLQYLREHCRGVEVIVVAALQDKETIRDAFHLGVLDYLIKPFTFERFQTALNRYVRWDETWNSAEQIEQKTIDLILEHSHRKDEERYPKGIQKKTMQRILEYMQTDDLQQWMNGEQIAQHVGLTGVTVRRYMNYLEADQKVIGRMEYATGGRPCMVYKKAP